MTSDDGFICGTARAELAEADDFYGDRGYRHLLPRLVLPG